MSLLILNNTIESSLYLFVLKWLWLYNNFFVQKKNINYNSMPYSMQSLNTQECFIVNT